MLLLAVSVQAQSLADAARIERERQSKLRPVFVFTFQGKSPEVKAGETIPSEGQPPAPAPPKELPKPQTLPPVDPVQAWNERLNQTRAQIRSLQDQETALMLQQNQITNQVYAVVTDPGTQERAQAQLGQTQQQLAAIRADLEEARRSLETLQVQGPPQK